MRQLLGDFFNGLVFILSVALVSAPLCGMVLLILYGVEHYPYYVLGALMLIAMLVCIYLLGRAQREMKEERLR